MNNIESNEYSSLSLTPPAEAHKIIDQIKQEIIILKTTKDVSKLPIETIMRAKAFVTAKISYELRSIIRPTFSFERGSTILSDRNKSLSEEDCRNMANMKVFGERYEGNKHNFF